MNKFTPVSVNPMAFHGCRFVCQRVSEQIKTIISPLLNTEYVESAPRPRRKYVTVSVDNDIGGNQTKLIMLDLNPTDIQLHTNVHVSYEFHCLILLISQSKLVSRE